MSIDLITLLLIIGGLMFAIAGIAGVILPALPGTPLLLIGLILLAWAEDFDRVGWITLGVLTLLMIVAQILDFIATAIGAKKSGAGPRAFWGASIGALVGIFFGLPGLILGPFVGAVIGELSAQPDWKKAGKAGLGAWVGLIVATATKISIAFTMIGIFVIDWW